MPFCLPDTYDCLNMAFHLCYTEHGLYANNWGHSRFAVPQ
jgi:hypothetical protein